jgi:hypothetical protein
MKKLHYKNPDRPRTDICQLVNFRDEGNIAHSSPKVKDQNLSQLNMPSKYATVLTCSFEKDQRTDLDVKMLS